MITYRTPQTPASPTLRPNEAFLVTSGDLRLSANQTCWPAQAEMEQQITAAFAAEAIMLKRAHPYDPTLRHGFIWNQRMGMDVFKAIPVEAPLIVCNEFNLANPLGTNSCIRSDRAQPSGAVDRFLLFNESIHDCIGS